MLNNNQHSAAKISACVGAAGGLGIWLLFLFFIFAFPDAQGGIALVISPFFSAAVGVLLAAITWGVVTVKRGNYLGIAFVLPALIFLVILLGWFTSEIWQLV